MTNEEEKHQEERQDGILMKTKHSGCEQAQRSYGIVSYARNMYPMENEKAESRGLESSG